MTTEIKNTNWQKIVRLSKITGILLGTFFILFLLGDKMIMPIYVDLGDEVEMPDVTEMDYTEAYLLLDKYEFAISKAERHDQYRRIGVVIGQKPEPYTVVKEGRRVQLTVSLGEKKLKVPDLIGISERDAEIRLRDVGLAQGEIFYQPSDRPMGTVISQQYEPQMEVSRETVINITVSIGTEINEIIMPNLVGKTRKDAEQTIKRKGLKLTQVDFEINNDILPNTVVNQLPAAGNVLALDDLVYIVVSKIDSTSSRNR